MHTESQSSSNVVSLASFKAKKETTNELARGRRPLYVSHTTGKASSHDHNKADLGDRISNKI